MRSLPVALTSFFCVLFHTALCVGSFTRPKLLTENKLFVRGQSAVWPKSMRYRKLMNNWTPETSEKMKPLKKKMAANKQRV